MRTTTGMRWPSPGLSGGSADEQQLRHCPSQTSPQDSVGVCSRPASPPPPPSCPKAAGPDSGLQRSSAHAPSAGSEGDGEGGGPQDFVADALLTLPPHLLCEVVGRLQPGDLQALLRTCHSVRQALLTHQPVLKVYLHRCSSDRAQGELVAVVKREQPLLRLSIDCGARGSATDHVVASMLHLVLSSGDAGAASAAQAGADTAAVRDPSPGSESSSQEQEQDEDEDEDQDQDLASTGDGDSTIRSSVVQCKAVKQLVLQDAWGKSRWWACEVGRLFGALECIDLDGAQRLSTRVLGSLVHHTTLTKVVIGTVGNKELAALLQLPCLATVECGKWYAAGSPRRDSRHVTGTAPRPAPVCSWQELSIRDLISVSGSVPSILLPHGVRHIQYECLDLGEIRTPPEAISAVISELVASGARPKEGHLSVTSSRVCTCSTALYNSVLQRLSPLAPSVTRLHIKTKMDTLSVSTIQIFCASFGAELTKLKLECCTVDALVWAALASALPHLCRLSLTIERLSPRSMPELEGFCSQHNRSLQLSIIYTGCYPCRGTDSDSAYSHSDGADSGSDDTDASGSDSYSSFHSRDVTVDELEMLSLELEHIDAAVQLQLHGDSDSDDDHCQNGSQIRSARHGGGSSYFDDLSSDLYSGGDDEDGCYGEDSDFDDSDSDDAW